MFIYTEDFVIYRFVIYRNSTRHKIKYDREICIRALLSYTKLPDISFKSILVIHTHKKEKNESFSHRQKAEANVSIID